MTEDDKTYTNYDWSTPIKEYQNFKGRKIPTYVEAIWHKPEGEFSYIQANVREIEYNCQEIKMIK